MPACEPFIKEYLVESIGHFLIENWLVLTLHNPRFVLECTLREHHSIHCTFIILISHFKLDYYIHVVVYYNCYINLMCEVVVGHLLYKAQE